jgi:hypothetical protein
VKPVSVGVEKVENVAVTSRSLSNISPAPQPNENIRRV